MSKAHRNSWIIRKNIRTLRDSCWSLQIFSPARNRILNHIIFFYSYMIQKCFSELLTNSHMLLTKKNMKIWLVIDKKTFVLSQNSMQAKKYWLNTNKLSSKLTSCITNFIKKFQACVMICHLNSAVLFFSEYLSKEFKFDV